ncbi:MAG: DUF790 family protein, partial [Proteobacteria bacterium]|nr:DUF790 family protein [Pseudomonadota bacterium]
MPILPKDFQRFSSEGTQVSPQYIKKTPGIETLAEQVLDCFRYSPDDTCDTLQDNLESLCQSSQRHRLLRGFIHILEGHLQFETPMDVSPVELRQALFIRAAQLSGEQIQNTAWRENAVCDVAKTFGVEPGQIDDLMYADLKSQRKILAFDDLSTDALIAEYNLALAKSLLLYAKSLSFTIDLQEGHASRLRRLFRHLRFHNLLFEAQNVTETTWQFKVDGPSAVLPQPQKYALSLANFLPTLYTFDNWCGNASISLDGRSQKVWQLKSDDFPPPDSPLPERIP